jgi:hypothetical protein
MLNSPHSVDQDYVGGLEAGNEARPPYYPVAEMEDTAPLCRKNGYGLFKIAQELAEVEFRLGRREVRGLMMTGSAEHYAQYVRGVGSD